MALPTSPLATIFLDLELEILREDKANIGKNPDFVQEAHEAQFISI